MKGNGSLAENKLSFGNMPVRVKIFISLSLFSLIMLILLWFFQVVFLDDFYRAIKTSELTSSLETVCNNIENDNFHEVVLEIQVNNSTQTMVYIDSGDLIYPAFLFGSFSPNRSAIIEIFGNLSENEIYRGFPEVDRRPNRGGNIDQFFTRSQGIIEVNPPMNSQIDTQELAVAKKVKLSNGYIVLVMQTTLIIPLDATVKTIILQLATVSLIMLIISIIISFVMSRQIANPIIKLTEASNEFARTNYKADFSCNGYREINSLSATLSYAAAELEKNERLKQELIANISHDLRTPLTLIRGYSEMMRDIPGENTPDNVQVIIDETQRLTSLVNDVLDLSKIQAGIDTVNLKNFTLTDSIKEIIDRFKKLIPDCKIEFEYEQSVNVNADPIKISQIIYNLVNNAITYSGKDKIITIIQKVNERKVKISVIDNGSGISPDRIDDIWDRYYKIPSNLKHARSGSGLGLSIVKGILEMHSAEYGVESEISKGTNFWFILDVII